MLELHGVSKHFGGVRAVDGVDLTVARGEILGLIGPNGSGKSTIVNLICGLFPLTSGRIVFDGADISDRADARARDLRHRANVPEYTPVWAIDRLAESLGCAEFRRAAPSELRPALVRRLARRPREIERTLEFFDLAHKSDELAANLAFGEQRRLEFARALVCQACVAAARRAGGGHECGGNRSARRPHPQDAARTASPFS